MADTRIDVPVVSVDGRELAPQLHSALLQLRVEESIQLPDRFTLHFDDPHFELFDGGRFTVGAKVEIGMQVSGEPVVITSGEVLALTVEQGITGRHELVITGYDLTHRLARRTSRRTFQAMTDADIASQIASEHSLRGRVNLRSGGVRNDYVLQANETDLAFLTRLAARNGADVWVTEDTLHVEPRDDSGGRTVTLTWGADLASFSVRLSASQTVDEVVVQAWDALRSEEIVAQSTNARPPGQAARDIAGQAKQAFGSTSRTSTWVEVPDSGVATTVAEAMHTRALAETVVLRGETAGNPWLAAGATVTLAGVGQRLADDYRVTSVTHLYGAGSPFRTKFVCGGLEPSGFADLVGGRTSAASVLKPAPTNGLMIGVVTDTADPEGLGRVRVKLPSLEAQAESNWARVVLAGAGPETGLGWIPEINDEVVVAFELGDTTRPLVLGGMWSQTKKPPADIVAQGEETKRRGMATAGANLIVLDDQESMITISVGGTSTSLQLAASSVWEGQQDVEIKAANVTISADQNLKLSAGGRVEISAGADVSVSGTPINLN
ncbi:VgrG-related protein [Microlunatus sp. Y2014]|uniref:VgrG-related protein n=1 Tax=Microlunatus sp. Y2014 TaxID=3418488 RepID=UPI003DA779F5